MLGQIVLSCVCLSVMVYALNNIDGRILLYSGPFYHQLNMSQKQQLADIVFANTNVSDYDAQLSQFSTQLPMQLQQSFKQWQRRVVDYYNLLESLYDNQIANNPMMKPYLDQYFYPSSDEDSFSLLDQASDQIKYEIVKFLANYNYQGDIALLKATGLSMQPTKLNRK
uniref:Uncharacterized protein n=1 Tax=Acrobeloides nanus TaxID=290746 RepID=A0A914E3E5_9BILA